MRVFKRPQFPLAAAFLALQMLGPCGCAPPVLFADAGLSLAEAGTSAFIEGELRSGVKRPLADVRAAIIEALAALDFPVDYTNDQDGYACVIAKQNSGDDISIRLRRRSSVVTTIQIRVGMLGDQAIARLIMEEADRVLKASAKPAPTPAPAPAPTPSPDQPPAPAAR